MPDRINRRELIINTAGDLFVQNGYEATSVRQIAEAAGMTEAALYYHFKEGKRELLQAVVECQLPDLMSVLDHCKDAETLPELIRTYGRTMAELAPPRIVRLRWLLAEFPKLNPEERALIHSKHIGFHAGLTELIESFVQDSERAHTIGWVLICSTFGYGQLFWSLDLKSVADFPVQHLIEFLAQKIP